MSALSMCRIRRASSIGLGAPKLLLVICLISVLNVPEEARAAEFRFAPGGRLFKPLLADPTETRFSILRYVNDGFLEGTIGGSWEALGVRRTNGDVIRAGIHAGVSTRLRASGATFPLEATDFLFGVHGDLRRGAWTTRFEFAHVSAHQADGFTNPSRPAFTYSREYFTLYGSHEWEQIRLYGSARYANHAIPDVKRWRLQAGGSADSGTWLGRIPKLYIAYNVILSDFGRTVAVHTGHAGVKFHNEAGAGIRAAIVGHRGRNEHGQFFDLRDDYVGLGLFFDL